MKFTLGDRVKFLNDIGGGKIIKIMDSSSVMVQTDDGFEFPYPISELILENANESNNIFIVPEKEDEKKKQTIEQQLRTENVEVVKKDNEEVNIYLGFVQQKDKSSSNVKIEMYLINDSNWNLMYVFQNRKLTTFDSLPGFLQPNFIENLNNYTVQELSEIKEIIIQLVFYRTIPYDIKEPVIKRFGINPTKFVSENSYVKNDFFEEKAFLIPVIEENPLTEAINKLKTEQISNVVNQKEVLNKKLNRNIEYTSPKQPDLVEIDLHINELLDDTTGLDPKTMLDYQMKKFEDELKKAKENQLVKKIVFIHGKGNGKLKFEIRAYLDRNNYKYQDASFQKYGFGATLIFV